VPVDKVNVRFVLCVAQIVVVPLMLAVGNGFTVTVALLPEADEHVVASVTLVIVYVLVVVGDTLTVWPLLIPTRLKVVVPSL